MGYHTPTYLAALQAAEAAQNAQTTAVMTAAQGEASPEVIDRRAKEQIRTMNRRAGVVKADYARCVDIATAAALKRMIIPGLMAVLIPVIAGFLAVGATRDTGPESQEDRIDAISKRVACPICAARMACLCMS